jgi:hypothetical protein
MNQLGHVTPEKPGAANNSIKISNPGTHAPGIEELI